MASYWPAVWQERGWKHSANGPRPGIKPRTTAFRTVASPHGASALPTELPRGPRSFIFSTRKNHFKAGSRWINPHINIQPPPCLNIGMVCWWCSIYFCQTLKYEFEFCYPVDIENCLVGPPCCHFCSDSLVFKWSPKCHKLKVDVLVKG